MQRILKNNTANNVLVNDVGIFIAANSQYTIPPTEYGLWEGSANVITLLSDYSLGSISTLTANDGTYDLAVNEGVRMIQGGFSRPISDGQNQLIKATVDQNVISGKNGLLTKSVISGANGVYSADVILKNALNRLAVDAIVTVEEVFGQDRFADTWFYIGTDQDSVGVGAAGDIVTVGIKAGDNAMLWPAVSVPTTVTSAMLLEVYPEIALADAIVHDLNTNANFTTWFKSSRIKDTSIVHISSKIRGEWGQRPFMGDFFVSATGTTVVQAAYDNIIMRGKSTSLSRDPLDPRVGILGVSGTVSVIPGAVGDLFDEFFKETGGNFDMNVIGSLDSPRIFSVKASVGKDILIREIRFFGTASSIKFRQFLSINTALANGIIVLIKSDNDTFTSPAIKTTEDFKHQWTFGGDWYLDDQPGAADFLASFVFETPFPIRAQGAFPIDDYIDIYVRDNLSAIIKLQALAFGFEQEV